MSTCGRRAARFAQFNADSDHQRMAGCASWAAFSARWRARQGLPLLHPLHVQYLTPQDFCTGLGQPLSPTEQRRLFRQYVEAAMQCYVAVASRVLGLRERLPLSADLAFVHAQGFQRTLRLRPDFVYGGRDDVGPYESEALLPTRPYGIPTTSRTFEGYWLDGRGLSEEDENT